MVSGESGKQAGIIEKTCRAGLHRGREFPAKLAGGRASAKSEERLQHAQIELFNECPAEKDALTLHGGNGMPSGLQ